ncbi:hypothetical protein NW733_03635 [Mycoplasmopsis felis]|uniref:hypothetical protein n=1 Tax=Mycoplasmopsis felis TaxID=33923 RepID=UPI0021E080FA|nr:hypothetical protein [Mycoplasmopsis felis]MCU9931761.1 hypothetical protein [Mycoplasmopsis felis]
MGSSNQRKSNNCWLSQIIKYKNFNIELPKKDDYKNDIDTILDKEVDKKYNITNHEERILECWNHFIKGIKYIPKKSKSERAFLKEKFTGTLGFPVWSEEFLSPSHLLETNKKWKNDFILKNKLLFEYNKEFISNWLKKWNYLNEFTKTEKN